jgi:protein transport protein SEC23
LFLQVLPYEPVPCKQCGAILNPYASVDYYAKIWVCPICYTRCHFPPHYQGISEQNVPAELFPQYTTVEYTLNRTVPLHPPTYLFVVDTAVAEDELHAAKSAITQVWHTSGWPQLLCLAEAAATL